MSSVVAANESPLRGKWLGFTILIAFLALGMVGLGFWQLGRLEQRRAENALIRARLKEPPLQLSGQAVNPDAAELRRATVSGVFDYEHEIYLRNQAYNDYPGVHVVTPLRIAGSDSAVLIDRGWVPLRDGKPVGPDFYTRPQGQVEVTGVVTRSRARLSALSPADPDPGPNRPFVDQWFRVEIPKIQLQTPYPLLPVYIQQGDVDPASGLVKSPSFDFPRADVQIDLSEGDHLGYAIQWFTFATIAVGGYFLLYRSKAARG